MPMHAIIASAAFTDLVRSRCIGDRFLAIEIDSHRGNPHDIHRRAHSVLAFDYVDEPGHPTRDALEKVLAFFRDRLRA